jgi:hypothetical protein
MFMLIYEFALGPLKIAAINATDSQQEDSAVKQLFRKVSPSVFVVEVLDEDGVVVASGSGVAIQTNSMIPGDSLQSFEGLDRSSSVQLRNLL